MARASIQHAATWPDIARGIKGDDQQKYNHPTWNYIDFPLYLTDGDRIFFNGKFPVNLSTEYPTKTPSDEYNVLQAIQDCQTVLHSQAGADAKALAYCWLFHLVGDIHQPLHSTALFSKDRFPEGDRGGNEIPLTQGRNLHALWDNLLGRQYYMRNVDKEVAGLLTSSTHTEIRNSASKELNPVKWAEESHALCSSVVYSADILVAVRNTPSDRKLEPINLPHDYYRTAGLKARKRTLAAGIRLGILLGGHAGEMIGE